MPNYFVNSTSKAENGWLITGSDFRHITIVRRARIGDSLLLVDENGRRFPAVIDKIERDRLVCSGEPTAVSDEGGTKVALYAAVLRGRSFDIAVRKAVEIGVRKIVPVITERCVPEYGNKAGSKSDRWQHIAEEAAKQSLRSQVPSVEKPMPFQTALAAGKGCRLLAHLSGAPFKDYASALEKPEEACVLIGPEGGFSCGEVEAAEKAGWESVSFPFPQMRAETAAAVIPALIIYQWSL